MAVFEENIEGTIEDKYMRSLAYSEHGLVGSLGDMPEFEKNEGFERDTIDIPFCVVLPRLVFLVFLCRRVEISEQRQ